MKSTYRNRSTGRHLDGVLPTGTEPRLIKHCQVMADRIFDPAFAGEHLGQAAS